MTTSRIIYYREYRGKNKDREQERVRLWIKNNPDKFKAQQTKYKKTLQITKRCPNCRKEIDFRKDYTSFHPIIHCVTCGTEIKIGKTLSDSNKNAHGIKLKVV